MRTLKEQVILAWIHLRLAVLSPLGKCKAVSDRFVPESSWHGRIKIIIDRGKVFSLRNVEMIDNFSRQADGRAGQDVESEIARVRVNLC